jgi:hypothetical protein
VIGFRRAALSLLISTLLFAGFTILAFTGLFDLVETRFYNPAAARAIGREIDVDTQVIEEFLSELQSRFAATLDEGAVRRSFLSSQGSDDIALRADLYGKLQESLGGLQSVRFIDSGGVRIHFSTWPPDILLQDRNSIAYRNYNAAGNNAAAYIPYGQVEATERLGPRLILDEAGERIVFSHPLKDSYDVYQGTALFSLSIRAVIDRMTAAGRIKIGEDLSLLSEPPGIIIGLPAAGRNTLLPLVARIWSENTLSLGRLNSNQTETYLDLVSRRANQNLYVGRLVNESLLIFPPAMRIILLICFFVTAYLFVFLIFNLRQDDMTVVRSRLKKLRVKLLEEYYERKGDLDWDHWKKDLEQRREDVRFELKQGLRPRTGVLAEIDDFIDTSWDDLMAITGGRMENWDRLDEDKLRALLKRFLMEEFMTPPSFKAPDESPDPVSREPEELETLDEAEAPELGAGEPEELEILDEVEAPKPETGEPEELETLDEAETPNPEAGEPEELETLDKAEAPEPATGEPEELETLDEAETPEPGAGEPEELEILDETETPKPEAGEPEKLETLDEAEMPKPETGKLEELETLNEAETPKPEAEKPEELEILDEAETPEPEAGEPEELETLDEAEAPEPGAGEPEELEILDETETPKPETGEPEELETLDEAEGPEPGTGGAETMTKFQEIDPLGFDVSGGSKETALNDLVSFLEFTPEPEENEREKDEAARSMAEHFEIQSPFAAIFSTLSELEFEPEPMESLEALEKAGLEPDDDSPETDAEELERSFTGIQLSIPFLTAPNSEITLLEAVAEDAKDPTAAVDEGEAKDEGGKTTPEEGEAGPVVAERDGVIYINENILNPNKKTLKGLNKSFKNLIDSILNNQS